MTEQGLIYRSGGRLQALALGHVIEIMRPLPIETTGAETALVRGMSVIRGEPTTVLDLAALSTPSPIPPRRLLSLKAGETRFALLADEVLGVQPIPEAREPMLQVLDKDGKAAVNALDPALRVVLQQLFVLPDEPPVP